MDNKFDTGKKVQEAGTILGALGVIGFIGIIWLMIYGNLSGNLGFTQDSGAYYNETIALSEVGATPTGASSRTSGAISSVTMTNATGGEIVVATNYSVSGVLIKFTAGGGFNGTNVNVSYTVTYDSDGQIYTDGVITNVTGGFGTFFGFSGTFFTIAAIVLLIFMLLGLLALVFTIVKMQSSKKNESGFAGH